MDDQDVDGRDAPTSHDARREESPVEEVVAVAGAVVTTAVHDLGGFIRSQRESAQVSLRQLAKRAGVSNPYLSQIERGLRKPSAEVLAQIAKGLRVSAEVLYVQAGILEQKEPSPVLDAVLTDTAISERQKQLLVEIYESFRRENAADLAAAAAAGATPASARKTAAEKTDTDQTRAASAADPSSTPPEE